MRLKVNRTPYSSTVGGGLSLIDKDGRVRFMVAIMGSDQGITKAETAIISEALASGIPDAGLELPDRPRGADDGEDR